MGGEGNKIQIDALHDDSTSYEAATKKRTTKKQPEPQSNKKPKKQPKANKEMDNYL